MARTRPNVPRTGRRRKLRVKKSSRKRVLGKRSPKQLAAAIGRQRVRKTRRR